MDQAQIAANKGIVIYTIFVGSPQWEVENALLMQYIADLTDNRHLDGDYAGGAHTLLATGGVAYTQAELPPITENYYRAETQAELQTAYESILRKIYTRLIN